MLFRSETCSGDPFTADVISARLLEEIVKTECTPRPDALQREEILRYNLRSMTAAGARLVLGTDAGIRPSKTFGSADHQEMTTYVKLGIAPSEALEAATSRAADFLGIADVGRLATGKRADFIVLDANPLTDINNTRKIAAVYLRGAKLDRAALLAKWKGGGNATR